MLNAGAEIVGYAPVSFRELIACNARFKAENEPWGMTEQGILLYPAAERSYDKTLCFVVAPLSL